MFNSTVIRSGLALGILGLLVACGQQPPPPAQPAQPAQTEPEPAGQRPAAAAFTLTNAEADQALRLQRGQVVELRLTADRTTGYTWIPTHNMRPLMSTDGIPQYEDAGPGAPGTEVWRFIALEPGHVHLVFEYRRPLEASAPPAGTLVYHFDIE